MAGDGAEAPAAQSRLHGLPPIIGDWPRVLVLGSFPSLASLAAGQYYAHPRNQFWRIVGAVLDTDLYHADYVVRCDVARAAGIAIWDSYATCVRPGSLDSAIRDTVPTDVAGLIRNSAQAETMGVPPAGEKSALAEAMDIPPAGEMSALAETVDVPPAGEMSALAETVDVPPAGEKSALAGRHPAGYAGIVRVCFNGKSAARRESEIAALGIETVVLPSTSPAHAGMPFEEKLVRWRAALTLCGRASFSVGAPRD